MSLATVCAGTVVAVPAQAVTPRSHTYQDVSDGGNEHSIQRQGAQRCEDQDLDDGRTNRTQVGITITTRRGQPTVIATEVIDVTPAAAGRPRRQGEPFSFSTAVVATPVLVPAVTANTVPYERQSLGPAYVYYRIEDGRLGRRHGRAHVLRATPAGADQSIAYTLVVPTGRHLTVVAARRLRAVSAHLEGMDRAYRRGSNGHRGSSFTAMAATLQDTPPSVAARLASAGAACIAILTGAGRAFVHFRHWNAHRIRALAAITALEAAGEANLEPARRRRR